METTIDALLNRRVTVEQPKKGFRVAVDTILLASAVHARTGEKVVDLGCGVGGAMLALAVRMLGLTVDGLEIQPELAELCRANIKRNNFEERMQVFTGDVTHLPGEVLFCYDHVMMNPPYHDAAKHDASPDESKATANTGTMEELEMWIISGARSLRENGMMMMIHRADRMEEILTYMKPHFGDTEIIQLLPKENEPPKRFLMRTRKGKGAKHIACRPMVMHRNSGEYTDEMQAILKHNKPIDFMPVKTK